MSEANDKKRERSTAKGLFTKSVKSLTNAIEEHDDIDINIAGARFNSLNDRWCKLMSDTFTA